jgi:hypothetical protein
LNKKSKCPGAIGIYDARINDGNNFEHDLARFKKVLHFKK